MHTVELLEQALQAAVKLGYTIRQEWLDGNGGGSCEIRGRKCLFLDLAQTPNEQLELVLDALHREGSTTPLPVEPALRHYIAARRAA